jgi:hypothetical protein
MLLGDLLLRGLYAFYTEHERCGEWEGGVKGERVFNLLALHLDSNSSARCPSRKFGAVRRFDFSRFPPHAGLVRFSIFRHASVI